MGTTPIQHVVWTTLVGSVIWSGVCRAQSDADSAAQPSGAVESFGALPMAFRALLDRPEPPMLPPAWRSLRTTEPARSGASSEQLAKQLADQLADQDAIDRDGLMADPLGPALPDLSRPTVADPLRGRKGGHWLIDDRWSLGLGMLRAGEIRPDEPDQPDVVSETLWMQVEGAQGQVHMLDAGLNWNIDPVDALRLSFEGGVRTLAQSDQAAANGTDITPADLDGNFVTQPVMGAAVRWSLTNWAYIEGSATGSVVGFAGNYLDLTAQAGVKLTPRTGLVAGYRFLDASFDTSGDRSTLSQDAVFAGLQISY